jgi:chromosome segregation ATPase
MNDAVAEKLVLKVINMLEEMSDLNIQVRRLAPSQETFNRINERIDAILGAIRQIEKGVSNDEKRIAALEEQNQSVQQALNALKEAMEKLTKKADEISGNTYAVKENAIAASSSNVSRFQKNENMFQQLENNLVEWFRLTEGTLIVLAIAQVIFFIIVLFKK